MMNFKQYPNITKICIPNEVNISNNFANAFSNMRNIRSVSIPNSVINIYNTFHNCTNLTTAVCGDNVRDMRRSYSNCCNITIAACGNNVTDMYSAFNYCTNLTTAVCGANVLSMGSTYSNCYNLTTAVCGDKVTNMGSTYSNCYNLTTAVCGNNVRNMFYAFYNCTNLTTAVCGNNVTDMSYTYVNCYNLTGSIKLGHKVLSINNCFRNVLNLSYIYIPNTTKFITNMNMNYAFVRYNRSIRMNIVFDNLATYNNVIQIKNVTGCKMNNSSTTPDYSSFNISGVEVPVVRYAYNTLYNVYVYCTT